MHFLVTGASGLVGGNTVTYILSLNENHTVLATDIAPRPQGTSDLPPGSSFLQADLSSIQDVDALFDASDKPIEAVIHMGAVPNPINVDFRVCHNTNVTASYNMMYTAASRGITKIVQASSVNATGLCYSDDKRRAQRFREQEFGIPLTEKDTPYFPEDAYSEFGRWSGLTHVGLMSSLMYFIGLSKYISEMQAEALCRSFPSIRIASLRFHHVCIPEVASSRSTHRDFWSWTDLDAAVRACYLGATADVPEFRQGHEAFYIMCNHLNVGNDMKELEYDKGKAEGEERIYAKFEGADFDKVGTKELMDAVYPGVKIKDGWLTKESERRGLFDSSKAERLLGWKHDVGSN